MANLDLQLAFEHGLEFVRTQRRAGLPGIGDGLTSFIVKALLDALGVLVEAGFIGFRQRQIFRVRGDQFILASLRIGLVARPFVSAGRFDQAGGHRQGFDVHHAVEQRRLRIDQAGLVTALPQGAGFAIGIIDVRHITAPLILHHAAGGFLAGWRGEDMDFIGQQRISVNRHVVPLRAFL